MALFGSGPIAPREIGCAGAILFTLLFASAMAGMVLLVACHLGLLSGDAPA